MKTKKKERKLLKHTFHDPSQVQGFWDNFQPHHFPRTATMRYKYKPLIIGHHQTSQTNNQKSSLFFILLLYPFSTTKPSLQTQAQHPKA